MNNLNSVNKSTPSGKTLMKKVAVNVPTFNRWATRLFGAKAKGYDDLHTETGCFASPLQNVILRPDHFYVVTSTVASGAGTTDGSNDLAAAAASPDGLHIARRVTIAYPQKTAHDKFVELIYTLDESKRQKEEIRDKPEGATNKSLRNERKIAPHSECCRAKL